MHCGAAQMIKLNITSLYNNNYKTSIAPISLKRTELSGAPIKGVGLTHSPGTMQTSSTNDQKEWKLGKDEQAWKGEFSNDDGKKICFLMT